MLKLYGNMVSGPCVKVRYLCELLDLDYEWVEMDFRSGDMKKPEYLALHPAGKVPAINDDGFKLFESEAILRYLCEKHASPLFPGEPNARAIVNQWSMFSVAHVGNAFGKVYFNRVIAPQFGIDVDERSLGEGLEWLDRYLPIVDHRLSESPYLAGAELSIADLSLLSVVDLAERADVSLDAYAALSKWREGIHEQSFWKAVAEASAA